MSLKHSAKKTVKALLETAFSSRNPDAILWLLRNKLDRSIYRKKFSTNDFIDLISSLGVKTGDTVFFQSNWNQFYNFTGSPITLVSALIEHIGLNGTLVMPANSDYRSDRPFDVMKVPTNAGLIAEIFRRSPGVLRSVHYNSSVCALGERASELVDSHQKSYTSWDKHSPFAKLIEYNALNVSVGLGYFFTYVTPIHCVDSMLREELPFYDNIFTDELEYSWVDAEGVRGTSRVLHRGRGNINLRRFSEHLQDVHHNNASISNLKCFSVRLKPLADEAVKLARKGIFLYDRPKPNPSDLVPRQVQEHYWR